MLRQGDVVGLVGFSGSVIAIHAHYQLQRGPEAGAEGLPAYFSGFERMRGDAGTVVESGTIDSGELVRGRAP